MRAAIDAIAQDPATGEALEQELTGFRKIALGSWRVVYRDEGRAIRIHAIGRRATVYSDLIERLRRSVRERTGRYPVALRSDRSRRATLRQPLVRARSGRVRGT